MRIDKTMKGEKVPFYIRMELNTMKAEVRNVLGETCIGTIDNDFNYIILPDEFKWNISGYGQLTVGTLKMNKSISQSAMEYNDKFLTNTKIKEND